MCRLFACVLLIGLAAFAAATTFTDCGSTTGEVIAVSVTDCPDGQDPCILKRGTKVEFGIKFTSKTDTEKMKAVVHGVISGVPMPFPLPQPDACKSGVNCPVKKGQSNTYKSMFNVRNSYPPVTVTVRYEIKNVKNEKGDDDMVCVEINCQIV